MLKIAWNSLYCHPLPEGHRFPMVKYELIPEQLLYEGTITEENLFSPSPVIVSHILETHLAEYWEKLDRGTLTTQEIRRMGFPYSKGLVERERIITGGTLQCCQYAMENGVSINVAGGTHHAFADRGEGFCLLNDIAVAANIMLKQHMANQILVIDLDVHQGNGTASIFKEENNVFTFSMHGKKNYPMHKEKSDLDIELEDGTNDSVYLNILAEKLPELFDQVQPDFVFFLSGVDVLESDKLGRLGMSIKGCKTRDEMVLKACKKNQVPLVISMGGGYSQRLSDIVEAHANTYRTAQEIYF
ncbi:MAG: histone deacetylase [Cyclobacteriaceae bacterium]|nr:histone deacetylase [Cyclobacteriaceae bacterium]